MTWLKSNWKTVALAVSMTLNVLGGGGVIPPVFAKALSAGLGALIGGP